VARRIKLSNVSQSKFTEETILQVADDLQSGRNPLNRTTISDDMVTGLKAECFNSGMITWHAHVPFGDGDRIFMKIGTMHDKKSDDYLSLKEAREIVKSIKAIVAKGIDPRDALLKRFIFELKRDGENFKLPKGM